MLSLSEKLLLTDWAVSQGIKVFWIEHDRVGNWLRWNPWLARLRKVSKLATTICVSEFSRKLFVELGWEPQKVFAIANGVDEKRLASSFQLPASSTNEAYRLPLTACSLHIGCVARLSPEKGVDVLIQAIADVPEVTLTVVGKGPEEGYLRKLIEQITDREGGQRRVEIFPTVHDLGSFYSSIDALVLPSRDNDPFGLVAAEAMMCDRAVIVTDQCGIASYLQNGADSLVVPADDPQALRRSIEQLFDAKIRAHLAAAGQQTAEEKFSLERMVDEYQKLLQGSL